MISIVRPWSVLVGFSSLAIALAGCGSSRAASSPADVAQDAPPAQDAQEAARDEQAPATREASGEAAPAAKTGGDSQLVCRAQDSFGVTSELRVLWKGDAGEGVLRQTAPSGMVHETKVVAERQGKLLFADDVRTERDYLSHAATVSKDGNKAYLRLGDTKAWSECE